MLGLALGDALGAKSEGGVIGGLIWKAIGSGVRGLLRWTDDTQMAIGLAESLVECKGLNPDHLAKRWADKMELMLLYHRDLSELRETTELASSITHAHPLGVEGAVLVACAVAMALQGDVHLDALREVCTREEYRGRLALAKALLAGTPSTAQVRQQLGNGIAAHESAVTAVYACCRFPDDFTAMIEYVVELGGDTDTIGAMAGGIFGAKNGVGALPADLLGRLEQRDEIETVARELHTLSSRSIAKCSVDNGARDSIARRLPKGAES